MRILRCCVTSRKKFGVDISFPIIAGLSKNVAHSYGLVHPDASDTPAVCAAFVIDDKSVLHDMACYLMTNGRSIEEFPGRVTALQTFDANGVALREGWQTGDRVIVPPPATAAAAGSGINEGLNVWTGTSARSHFKQIREPGCNS